MSRSESIKNLATALFKAQHQIKGAYKNAENPFYKSNYADLESVWEAIRQPLFDNELSVIQPTGHQDGIFGVFTVLMHSSGEYWEGFTEVRSKDGSPQAQGSGITYSRRYGLSSMLGVYSHDDDGNAAQGPISDPGANRGHTPPNQNKPTETTKNNVAAKVPSPVPPKIIKNLAPGAAASQTTVPGVITFTQANELRAEGLKLKLTMDQMSEIIKRVAGVNKFGEIPIDKLAEVKKEFLNNEILPF